MLSDHAAVEVRGASGEATGSHTGRHLVYCFTDAQLRRAGRYGMR